MDRRTLSYVKGRFGDYYRRNEVDKPRDHRSREWAYVVFGGGMVRHKSILDLGSLETWLADVKPQHVYYSSARYTRPDVEVMQEKGWTGADLIFDLDADHLEDVTEDDSYVDMLAKCKESLMELLSFVEDDLGFRDTSVVFSGGRGYHIHVYDDQVQGLDSGSRREIVDYIKGVGFEPNLAFSSELAEGSHGRKTPTEIRRLSGGNWSERIRRHLSEYADRITGMSEDEAVEELQGYDEVGEKKARKILRVFEQKREAIESGNLDLGKGLESFWNHVIEEAVEESSGETDEPVTTDTRRLIRLPGSLHGGTGFRVTTLDRTELGEFRPTRDGLTFGDREIEVDAGEEREVTLNERTFNIEEGLNSVPEYAGIYLMLDGSAELG
ncbi:MAG: DNA primase catalytic subunit PriS [Halobacteria archaeon]